MYTSSTPSLSPFVRPCLMLRNAMTWKPDCCCCLFTLSPLLSTLATLSLLSPFFTPLLFPLACFLLMIFLLQLLSFCFSFFSTTSSLSLHSIYLLDIFLPPSLYFFSILSVFISFFVILYYAFFHQIVLFNYYSVYLHPLL